jgi:hypothetical protein
MYELEMEWNMIQIESKRLKVAQFPQFCEFKDVLE